MAGLGEVDDQVAGAQPVQRHPRQPGPLLLAGAGDRRPGVRPGLRGQPRAVVRRRAGRAPPVRLAQLPQRVGHRPLARLGGGGVRAERPGGRQPVLLPRGPLLLPGGQFRQLLRAEPGEHPFHLAQPAPHVVTGLLPASDESVAGVGGGAGPPDQPGRSLLGGGQPTHRVRPVPGDLGDQMPVVQRGLRIAGQQQGEVRGEAAAALVLLPGEPARFLPALLQGGPGAGEVGGQPYRLGLLPGQLHGRGVVGVGGLCGQPVQLLQVRQQPRDGHPTGPGRLRGRCGRCGACRRCGLCRRGRLRLRYGHGGHRRESGLRQHRRRARQTQRAS